MCLVGGWRGKGKGRRIGLLSSLSLLSLGFDMGEVGQFRFSFHPVLLPTPLRTSGGGGGRNGEKARGEALLARSYFTKKDALMKMAGVMI